jgi:hypothetical protein
MLEEIRKGKLQDLEYWVKDIIFQEQKFVHLLQPEDKQWLLDLDRTEVDCFVARTHLPMP